jgi:hypothetical protein
VHLVGCTIKIYEFSVLVKLTFSHEARRGRRRRELGAGGALRPTPASKTEHCISTYGFVLYDNGQKWLA